MDRIARLVLTISFLGLATSILCEAARGQGPHGEGPLGNDVFLPISEIAAKELAAGDGAQSKPGADVEASRATAFEAWRRALAGSENGDSATMLAPSDLDRGTESVDRAVVRRLVAAGPEAVSAWRARFETIAASALDAAGFVPDALARVERGFPMTRAAARSALALSDLAFESGDAIGARTWLGRARSGSDPLDRELSAAIDRRAGVTVRSPPVDVVWDHAADLALEAEVTLASTEPVRRGIDPGIAFLEDGRVCVQGADNLHVVAGDGRVQSRDVRELTRAHGWNWLSPFADRGERWALRPATDGKRIALVAGRAAATRGNALLLLDMNPKRADPRVAWGYWDAGFRGEDGKIRKAEELIGPGLWEFEPGPRIVAGTVLVQARQWIAEGTAEGEAPPSVDERAVRAWCIALDLETGVPRWKRLLAVGASVKGRLQGARGFARPAQELAIQDGLVLAGTGIGAGAEIDLCDGRVRSSWRFRRPPEGGRTWVSGPPLVGASNVWAPPESDRLYFLRPDGDLSGGGTRAGGPFTLPPREIGEDSAALAVIQDRVLLLSGGGGASTLTLLSPASGERIDSVEFPTGERLPPHGLAGPSRAILASDRKAYLFAIDRDLALLDSIPLPAREESPEGEVAARGDRVYIAGERRLWILRVR